MQAAGVDWQLNNHGGAEHAFHLPPVNSDGSLSTADTHELSVPGVGYHPAHAERAWRQLLDLLDLTWRVRASSAALTDSLTSSAARTQHT